MTLRTGRCAAALTAALISLTGVACGGGEGVTNAAVEATEANVVRAGGVSYRVVRFRELNPASVGDRALLGTLRPASGHALFAAFIEACNRGGARTMPTAAIHIEDAFGKAYDPVDPPVDADLAYAPRPLGPGDCLPAVGTIAERSFGGAAVVFDLPLEVMRNRPLVLQIGDARVVLDL